MENSAEDIPLDQLIKQAFDESERLKEYASYAPIYNSRQMLHEISGYIKTNEKSMPSHERAKCNVGLLAAKSLDFDVRFNTYALVLHKVWSKFLAYLGIFRRVPTKGDKEYEAYEFYRHHNFNDDARIMDHLDGIDFSRPVDNKFLLNAGNIVVQWSALCMPQGNYYADKGRYPSCLGINDMQEDYLGYKSPRIEGYYELQVGVVVLKSTAAAVLDRWSIKGSPVQTKGGCIQYFNANDKQKFKLVCP